MTKNGETQPQRHRFAEVVATGRAPQRSLTITDLGPVKLTVTAELGKADILIREVLDLKRGSVITLNKPAGELTDICVNGLPLARGEVVVIGDTLHVRIQEILGVGEREEGTHEG